LGYLKIAGLCQKVIESAVEVVGIVEDGGGLSFETSLKRYKK